MFCAKCKAEYNEGVTVCAECGEPLVDALPEARRPGPGTDLGLVTIVRTFVPQDIAIIESLLDDAGIDYHIEGEMALITYPMVTPASVMVRSDQADEARELLKDLKLGLYVFGPDDDTEIESDESDEDSMK